MNGESGYFFRAHPRSGLTFKIEDVKIELQFDPFREFI